MSDKDKFLSLLLSITTTFTIFFSPCPGWTAGFSFSREKLSPDSFFKKAAGPGEDADGVHARAGVMSLADGAGKTKNWRQSLRIVSTIQIPRWCELLQELGNEGRDLMRFCEKQKIIIHIFSCQGVGKAAPMVFREGNDLYVRDDLEDFLHLREGYASTGRLFVLAELRHDILGHDPLIVGESVDTAAEEVYAFLVGELRVLLGFMFPAEVTAGLLQERLEKVLIERNLKRLISVRELVLEKVRGTISGGDAVISDSILQGLVAVLAQQPGRRAPALVEMIAKIYGYETKAEEIFRELVALIVKTEPEEQRKIPADDDPNWQHVEANGQKEFFSWDVQLGKDVWLRVGNTKLRIIFYQQERLLKIDEVRSDGSVAGSIDLTENSVIKIGRDPDWFDLQILDRGASRKHLEVKLELGSIYIRDLGSLNGFDYYDWDQMIVGEEEPASAGGDAEEVARLFVQLPAELEYLAEIIKQNASEPEEQRNIIFNRQEERYCQFFERAKRKNVELLVAYDPADTRLPEYLERLITIIEEIPAGILAKAGKPLVYKVGRIKAKNVLGVADVGLTVGFAGAGMTQYAGVLVDSGFDPLEKGHVNDVLTDGRYEKLRETVIHELIGHKLATVTRADCSLIMPREDWVRVMKLNRAVPLQVFKTRELKKQFFEYMRKHFNYYLDPDEAEGLRYLDPYEAEGLRAMDDERFLYAIRNNYTLFQLYYQSLLELVAFSVQDKDLLAGGYNPDHRLAATQRILMENLLREDEPAGTDKEGNEIYRTWRFSASSGWCRQYLRLRDSRWEFVPGIVIVDGQAERERAEKTALIAEKVRGSGRRLHNQEDLGLGIVLEHDLPDDFLPKPFSLAGQTADSWLVPAAVSNKDIGDWPRDLAGWNSVLGYYGYRLMVREGDIFKEYYLLNDNGNELSPREQIVLRQQILTEAALRYACLIRILHLGGMAGSDEQGSIFSVEETTPFSVLSLDYVWRLEDDETKRLDRDLWPCRKRDIQEARERIRELADKLYLSADNALELFKWIVFMPDNSRIMGLFSHINTVFGSQNIHFSFDDLKTAVRQGVEADEEMNFSDCEGQRDYEQMLGITRYLQARACLPEELVDRSSAIAYQIIKLVRKSTEAQQRSLQAEAGGQADVSL